MCEPSQGLQVGEDLDFKRRSWQVQKIGWVVMVLVLATAGLGLLGGAGPLVQTVTGTDSAVVKIRYPRFIRVRSPINVHVELSGDAVSSETLQISVNRSYLQQFSILTVSPQPMSEELVGSSIVYTFPVSRPAREVVVTFIMEAEYAGLARGAVRVDGEPAIEFWQMAYP